MSKALTIMATSLSNSKKKEYVKNTECDLDWTCCKTTSNTGYRESEAETLSCSFHLSSSPTMPGASVFSGAVFHFWNSVIILCTSILCTFVYNKTLESYVCMFTKPVQCGKKLSMYKINKLQYGKCFVRCLRTRCFVSEISLVHCAHSFDF